MLAVALALRPDNGDGAPHLQDVFGLAVNAARPPKPPMEAA
jgi:hypothetical protein